MLHVMVDVLPKFKPVVPSCILLPHGSAAAQHLQHQHNFRLFYVDSQEHLRQLIVNVVQSITCVNHWSFMKFRPL
jgi:hypothetical protein